MILRLSPDKSRASSIGSRYFTTDAEWSVIDASAFGFSVEAEEVLGKDGKVKHYVLQSPALTVSQSMRGSLLLSSHPELGGDLKLITPDANPRQGYLTVKTSSLNTDLPYHFRVSILPHGHMS